MTRRYALSLKKNTTLRTTAGYTLHDHATYARSYKAFRKASTRSEARALKRASGKECYIIDTSSNMLVR